MEKDLAQGLGEIGPDAGVGEEEVVFRCQLSLRLVRLVSSLELLEAYDTGDAFAESFWKRRVRNSILVQSLRIRSNETDGRRRIGVKRMWNAAAGLVSMMEINCEG